MRTRVSADPGFSLVEVLVAATTVVIALAGVAQLLTAAAATTSRARSITLAAVFAQEKLESLIPRAAMDPALAASAPGVLDVNIDGYCDFLDGGGAIVGSGVLVPVDAVYVRRWAIQPMSTSGGLAMALHVLVVDARRGGVDARAVSLVRYVP